MEGLLQKQERASYMEEGFIQWRTKQAYVNMIMTMAYGMICIYYDSGIYTFL